MSVSFFSIVDVTMFVLSSYFCETMFLFISVVRLVLVVPSLTDLQRDFKFVFRGERRLKNLPTLLANKKERRTEIIIHIKTVRCKNCF